MSAETVRELLGPPDFSRGHPDPWRYEFWNLEPTDSPLAVDFDSTGKIWRLEGGLLQIAGEPLPQVSPDPVTARLGRPLRSTPGLHTTYLLRGDARLIILESAPGPSRPLLYRAGGR